MSQFFTVPEIYDDMSKFCQDSGTKFPLPKLFNALETGARASVRSAARNCKWRRRPLTILPVSRTILL